MSDIQNNKDRFLAICKEHIQRDGIEKLLAWLEKSDFFTAPASRNNHLAHAGGLLEHSLNVYDELRRLCGTYAGFATISEESIAIMALFHDLCKVNFYVETTRNVKENGVWKTVPYYSIDDQLPYGHGEKSVYIASGYMRLTRDEAFAIRYHMGFAGAESVNAINNIGRAFEMFPLAFALSVADMEASYYIEGLVKN